MSISTPIVSVIIPVFNSAKYIEDALKSVLKQTLSDIEIIIIDDGSTDGSLDIINSVLDKNNSKNIDVMLISRENRGVAATRNEGLQKARGIYLMQIDSDDWISHDMLELLYKEAFRTSAEIVTCDYVFWDNKRNSPINQNFISDDRILNLKNLLRQKICGANWNKLVKRSLFKDNNIRYFDGLNMGEDFFVTYQLLYNAKKISHVSKALYYYNNLNEFSLTYSYSENSLNSLVKLVNLIEFHSKNNFYHDLVKHEIDFFKLNTKSLYVYNYNGDYNVIKKGFEIYNDLNKLILKEKISIKFKIVYICYLLGFSFLIRIILRKK